MWSSVGIGVCACVGRRGTVPALAGRLKKEELSRCARGVELSSARPAAAGCCVSDVPDAAKESCRFGIHGSAAGRSILG